MPRKDDNLCKEIRGYVETWRDYFSDNIKNYHYWFDFVMGRQWDKDEEKLFKTYKKKPLVMNKLSPLSRAILADQRENTPNLELEPQDQVPVEVVDTRKALVKNISFNSDTQVIYQEAFKQAIIGGFGAFWLNTIYINHKSFDQEPKFEKVTDATKCFWDPTAEHPCKIDGMHAGFTRRMSRAKFKAKYGARINNNIGTSHGDLDQSYVWSNEKEITVTYCQRREIKKDTLYELSDGESYNSKELEIKFKELDVDVEGKSVTFYVDEHGNSYEIVKKRTIYPSVIKCYECAGDYILEETELTADDLSIFFVDQDSYYDKKGQQITIPYFKDAEDAQKYLNYLATQSAYILKVSRYDQFMASKKNVKSPETQRIWRDPARHQGALIYDVDPDHGTKPERLTPPELPQSLTIQYERTLRDIETNTGMYDTRMGAQGNESSGIAIDKRVQQGMKNNIIAYDSLNRAIAAAGYILNQMISRIYDTPRRVTLDMPDTGRRPVNLNEPSDEYANTVDNDMTKGEFKIRLVPGPSWEGQQREALESLQLVLNASPGTFNMIADLYADNLPLSNKTELRNRLRTLVDPQIIEAGKTGKPLEKKDDSPPPEVMALMLKAKEADQKYQLEMAKLEQNKEKMGMDYQQKMQELQTQRLEEASALREQMLRYLAETGRTESDAQIAHANNLVKILTHLGDVSEPKEPKEK